MLFPEFLYTAFQRPGGRPPYTRMLSRSVTVTAAGPTPFNIVIPDDADAIIENLFFKATVAGGETISRVSYYLVPPATSSAANFLIDEDFSIGAAEYNKNFENTPLFIPRSYGIVIEVTKSAAVQSATYLVNAWGFFIPPMDL